MNREQIEAYNAELSTTVVLLQWIKQHAEAATEALDRLALAAAKVSENV